MTNQWMTWLNCLIAGIIVCLFLGIGIIWFKRPSEIVCTNPISKQCRLPKSAFVLHQDSYKQIGEPLLTLQNAPPTLQLPDLRQHLVYYGKNGRPDANSSNTHMHFSFVGSKTIATVSPQEKLYLLYDKKTHPSHYIFSPNNAETSLWLESASAENESAVKIFMKNDKGELIVEPDSHAQFKLPEKEFIRYAGSGWEISNLRVDGTLLARQKARWFGPDRFLEQHGGDEYSQTIGKQRIDFGENDEVYSVFASAGDCLIWDGKQWKESAPGEESLKYPLLVVKKIDERIMTFELWDVEGKGKIVLNILKSTEPWLMQNPVAIQQTFKFMGARTKTQCVFEINRERMLIRPADWLLMTNKGWKKLTTEEEIDDYVKRKTPGTLFVFEGLSRKDDKQIMLGTLYNPTRSDFQKVELSMQRAGTAKPAAASKDRKKSEESDRDDEDYDDDDYDDDDDDDDENLRHVNNNMLLRQEQLKSEQERASQRQPLPPVPVAPQAKPK